jgi:hypothetical protein
MCCRVQTAALISRLMIPDIRQLLLAGPFEPFFIITSNGNRYRVASPDHASTNPQGSRVVVWFEDDSSVTVAGSHIAALEKESSQKPKPV